MTKVQDFKNIFLGEYVEILCKNGAITEDGESIPLVVQGYILEVDEEFIYLGENALEVKSAVKRSDVSYIEITDPKTMFEQLLEDMPVPEDEHDKN